MCRDIEMQEQNTQKLFQRLQIFSGGQLKAIAMLSMLLDHVNKALIYPYLDGGPLAVISDLFEIVGRIAFPIFCFMLVEGFFKTRDRRKYLLYLLLFGLISEVPFDMFTTAVFFNMNWNNIMFTLAFVLVTIWCIDVLKDRMEHLPRILWYLASVPILVCMSLLSMMLGLDYEYHAILIGYFYYIFYEHRIWAIPFGFLSMYKEPWALLGFALTLTYTGKRGRQNKILNYWFYPVHMLILGILRFILGI